jgi:CSLREA domain-containing protein
MNRIQWILNEKIGRKAKEGEMKKRFCTILMVALLVLLAGSLGVAQEGTPPAPEGWDVPRDLRPPASLPQGEAAVPWFPPERSGPGAVITVTTTDDELNSDGDCALREAIEAANTDAAVDACVAGSGADTVLVPAGTYLLALPGGDEDANQSGDLDILDDLTLTGDGAEVTVLDGDGLDRLLQIHTGRTVTVSALTLTGGLVVDDSGSAIENRGTLTLNDATLWENTVQSVDSYGSALANDALLQDATAYVNHSLIVENTAPCCAGLGNTADTGLTAELHVEHTSVISNTAVMFAGGVYNGYFIGATDAQSYLTLTDSLVAANSVPGMSGDGGGIFTIGGEADNRYAWMTLERTTVRDNTAINDPDQFGAQGAGVLIEETTTTVMDSTISGNTGTGVSDLQPALGGGMAIWDSNVALTNTTVSGNQVLGEAGGSGAGGGITLVTNNAPASLTLLNVTVVGNSADLLGGAIVGANVFGFTPTLTFKNTLIGGNTSAAYPSCGYADFGYGPPEFSSLGNNLEDYDTCEFDQPTDWPNTDGLLGPLQDNGGPTWTHALLAGSPAIDAGDDAAAPPADQRGVPRPQGPASDIGSYEANLLVNTCDDELNSDGDCSLREAIEAANTDTAVDACMAGSGHDYITLPACTYTLAIPGANEDNNHTGDLDILDDLTIYGAGADTTVVDGDQLDRIVQIHPGHTAEIDDLSVTGGLVVDDDGSAIENLGTLTLNDATVRGNTLQTSGNSWGGALANSAAVQDATTYVNHSLIAENTAPCCAGLQNATMAGLTAALHVDHTSVVSNTATMFGGGVYNGWLEATGGEAILTLTDSLVAANSALGMNYPGGGGIYSVGWEAANIYTWLTLERTTVRDNTATNEPGVQGARGAGVAIWGTTTAVLDSTISHNIGTGVGNVLPAVGGGLAILDANVTLSNTTVSGNEVLGEAGGSGAGGGITLVSNDAPTSLTLLNVTLADNSADVEGGAIASANVYGFPVTLTFKNTLIGGNIAAADPSCGYADYGYGPPEFISLGNNLEDYDLCEFDQPSDLPNTDPMLGPLQDNGGPTWTHALLEGSLARDHGDDDACPPADQRGVPRPQGPHCDIGSFEAYPDAVPPAVMAVSPPDGATDVALDATLVLTFSEPISVPTFAYSLSPDPGGWTESWGPNDTVVSLTHDLFAYGTVYAASVTAAEDRAGNPLASPYAWSFTTAAEPCDPVETVAVEGPASLLVGETGVYTATYAPLTATLPVTLTWENGTLGATAVYSWTLPGTYTLTVTATNPCAEAVGSFPVEVSAEIMYRIYLPLVLRDSG